MVSIRELLRRALLNQRVLDVSVGDGRVLRVHDSGAHETNVMTLVWHHGSPQTGALLEPVLAAALERGIRLVSYGRPSYGGSSAQPGRTVGDAAADVAAIADAIGVERFATMGASGGGPHALACAALMPELVSGVVTLAGLAPLTDSFDWWGGMVAPGGLQAAMRGRDARAAFAAVDEFDPGSFNDADYAALNGEWAALGDDVAASAQWGDDGLIDDDVVFVAGWGFEISEIEVPVLVVQGADDRVVPAGHGAYLHGAIGGAELRMLDGDGHVSVLREVASGMDWLLERR